MSSSENNENQEKLTPAQQRQREKMKLYALLNILFIIYFIAFMIALAVVQEKKLMVTAISGDVSVFCLLNGFWLLATKNPSYLCKDNVREKRKPRGWVLLLCGLVTLGSTLYLAFGL